MSLPPLGFDDGERLQSSVSYSVDSSSKRPSKVRVRTRVVGLRQPLSWTLRRRSCHYKLSVTEFYRSVYIPRKIHTLHITTPLPVGGVFYLQHSRSFDESCCQGRAEGGGGFVGDTGPVPSWILRGWGGDGTFSTRKDCSPTGPPLSLVPPYLRPRYTYIPSTRRTPFFGRGVPGSQRVRGPRPDLRTSTIDSVSGTRVMFGPPTSPSVGPTEFPDLPSS